MRRAFGLSAERTGITRNPAFSRVEAADLDRFKQITTVESSADQLRDANQCWLGNFGGDSEVLLCPRSTKEVSEILKHCNDRNLAVNVQGGNTGLVGGSVPVFDEVILSLRNLDNIESIDQASGVAVCGAGTILQNLNDAVGAEGLIVPLDLGAKGSCHIGGNVSSNAGGLRYVRYGSLHGSVLGVEAVLADGTILDLLSTLRKNNTGYDLKQLFIGGEGTLGVVTKVSLLCPPKPLAKNILFVGLPSFSACVELFSRAKRNLGEILSAYEFLDHHSRVCAWENLEIPCPIESEYPFYVLIETSGSYGDHDQEKLEMFLEKLVDEGVDGTLASNDTQISNIWSLREGITLALNHDGHVWKYDVSLPVQKMYNLVEDMRERLKGAPNMVRVVGYGHMGDSNLHLNITASEWSQEVSDLIEPYLYERVSEVRGSVSAEHGIGLQKRNVIHYSQSPEALALMKQIKNVFDPKGILMPYKVFPSSSD